MPVLYAGHYHESSGWGQVTRDNILALDIAGVDVVPRAITLGLANFEVPERICELEQGDPTQCSVIIQHVLPHYMKYDSHFRKNIGVFELESQNIKHTQWVDHLNIMDELWVPCRDMLDMNGVHTPSFLVPHACDLEEYSQDYSPLGIQNLQGKFVFYFIGQLNRRKHITALLRAFHTEFNPFEPVELVIKTNHHSMSPEDLAHEVVELTNKTKSLLGLYADVEQYKQETIITMNLPREELLQLHASCDCFVCPSFGEAWCAPAFDAMAMSNIVIAGDNGGPKGYIAHGCNGFLVDGSMEPMFGETEALEGFGTARELEFDISVSDLQKQMRRAYQLNHVERATMKTHAAQEAAEYSYAKIGGKMKELLNV